jgi:hypothetical protein
VLSSPYRNKEFNRGKALFIYLVFISLNNEI